MGKKISETDRLLDFALSASAESLQTAIDTLRSVQRNRFTRPTTRPRNKKAVTKTEPDNKAAAAGD